ncbi:Clp protease N-terminal domain-containing protein [Nocardia sp. NPDC004068]|uniref:Clp protease N-terminal domain-containing protein n=1 Tax=Nocardia sp. NPDC004068 TaxID=3364303 RepID=UPI00369B1EA8
MALPVDTELAQALEKSYCQAACRGHEFLEPVHLLAVLYQSDGGVRALLTESGVNTAVLSQQLELALADLPRRKPNPTRRIRPSHDLLQLLAAAETHAARCEATATAPKYVLLAALSEWGVPHDVLARAGASRPFLEHAVRASDNLLTARFPTTPGVFSR